MNNNAALTLTSMHKYLPSTKPPYICLLGLVDSLEKSVQNSVLLPLLFQLLILYRDGGISTGRQLLDRPRTHVYRGTLVTISIQHHARLVVWVG